jgi:hypothetical protein
MKKRILSSLTAVTASFAVLHASASPVPPPTAGQNITGEYHAASGAKANIASHSNGIVIRANISSGPSGISVMMSYPQVTASPYYVFGEVVDGPNRLNAPFADWAHAWVDGVYTSGEPMGVQPNISHSYRLTASDLSQSPDTTNNTVWFGVHIVAKPGHTFSMDQLTFIETSSDGNSLGKTNTFADPTDDFSPWAYGIIWDTNGIPRESDTILDDPSSGPWDGVQLNEAIFVGAQGTYYIADTNVVASYIDGFNSPTNEGFTATGRWYLQTTNATGLSQITLQTAGVPLAPVQTMNLGTADNATNVIYGLDMETNRTFNLFYTPVLTGSKVCIATVNSGDVISWPTDSSLGTWGQGFFNGFEQN